VLRGSKRRVAIACVGASGEPVNSRSEIATATLLRAAVDAASGRLWPVASSRGPCRRTLGRRIEFAARLLGLGPRREERTREPVAEALGLPLLDLRDASASFAAQHTWHVGRRRARRASPARVHHHSIDGLLRSGCIGDAWGRPSRWDPGGYGVGRLLPLF